MADALNAYLAEHCDLFAKELSSLDLVCHLHLEEIGIRNVQCMLPTQSAVDCLGRPHVCTVLCVCAWHWAILAVRESRRWRDPPLMSN